MESNEQNLQRTKSDEIDLNKLFIKIILFFQKHSIIFLIAIAIGIVVGIALSLMPKKSYFTAYLVAETSLSKESVFEVVKSIKYSVEQHDNNSIEKKLKISKEYSIRIRDLDIENVLIASGWDSDGKPTSLVQSKLFKIKVYFSVSPINQSMREQQSFLDSIRNGIVMYLNDNQYLKERQKYNKIVLAKLILETGIQLNKLDTLQKSVIEQRPQRGQVVVENANKQSYSGDILALLERKLRLEMDYELDKPIMIVEDFNYSTVVEPGISKNKIAFICFAFFAIALMIALIIEIKGMVQKQSSKNSV